MPVLTGRRDKAERERLKAEGNFGFEDLKMKKLVVLKFSPSDKGKSLTYRSRKSSCKRLFASLLYLSHFKKVREALRQSGR